ncbi:ABC transporter ATP-binding protein [Candidatus Pacearchaeota archaeon]|nr:ABC transporter ATP-binding protein [Candidatus Pacearchaeota archaeon]
MKHEIELKNVTKYYYMGENVVKALDGISIHIETGDFVAIMGPSGSGKSTGMNLTGSLDYATKGEIYLDGMNIEELSKSELAQVRGKKIGFIFQSFNLIPNLTALENVMLPMTFQGIDKDERKERAGKLLEKVELKDREDHYPNQLSGGQQQRVAIARSLANDPEIILADEPTGNLDTRTGEIVIEFLEKLNSEGKTIIMVTHDPNLAQKHARTIYWLKDGKVEKVTKKIKGKWVVVK